jgi:glycosyltransferase involved in cell wall biosynthesis
MSCAISVVVCTYTDHRWDELNETIDAIQEQTLKPLEVIVVVDHNPALLQRATAEIKSAVLLPSTGRPGLAGARNTGARASKGTVVAFIDDDAVPSPDWLERLAEPYADESVVAVGGAALPGWSSTRPVWFPPEFDWVVGCTYRGLPEDIRAVRNLIGANMSFRREVFDHLEFFFGLGHAGGQSLGGEETDFCIRLGEALPSSRIVYEPCARVCHHVPPERMTFSYFVRRCYAEGLSKGVLSRRVGSRAGLASERAYVRAVLPAGARDALVEMARTKRFAGGFLRITASVIGVTVASSGYAVSRLRRLSTMSRKGHSGEAGPDQVQSPDP